MLDENAAIIKTISDYQNMGKHNETVQYQWNLHRNLMYLASLADANQNLQNLLPVRNRTEKLKQFFKRLWLSVETIRSPNFDKLFRHNLCLIHDGCSQLPLYVDASHLKYPLQWINQFCSENKHKTQVVKQIHFSG